MAQFYVYVLSGPDGEPFYIGKGKGGRVDDHEKEAKRNCQCQKCTVIRDMWHRGEQVGKAVVFETEDEQAAFTYERNLIAHHGRNNLCNQTNGGAGVSGYVRRARKTEADVRATPEAVELLNKALAMYCAKHNLTLSEIAERFNVNVSTLWRARKGNMGTGLNAVLSIVADVCPCPLGPPTDTDPAPDTTTT